MRIIKREELIDLMERKLWRGYDSKDIELVMSALSEVLYEQLSSNGKDDLKIKLFDGFTIEREFIPEKICEKGMMAGETIKEHFNVKARISKYYTKKINKQ